MKSKFTKLKNFLKFHSNIFKIIFLKPRYFFFLFKIRILSPLIGDTYYLSPRCLTIKLFEDRNFKQKKDFNLKKFGNYFLDFKMINKNSKTIVYSGGVGKNISFDKEGARQSKTEGLARMTTPAPCENRCQRTSMRGTGER